MPVKFAQCFIAVEAGNEVVIFEAICKQARDME
jgi:hypothetical protein